MVSEVVHLGTELLHVAFIELPILDVFGSEKSGGTSSKCALSITVGARKILIGVNPVVLSVSSNVVRLYSVSVGVQFE